MIKFLKSSNGTYVPVDLITAIVATTNDAEVVVKAKANSATIDEITVVTAGKGAEAAEAIIEEINFGKQVIIDLLKVYPGASSAAWSD